MHDTQKKWFSIVLAMWIVLILSLIGLYLLEYMIPFSRNVKGIEHASQSFYESYSWVEENVLLVYSWSVWADYSKSYWGIQDYEYSFIWSWDRIPVLWQWNSEYDDDFSRLSQTETISLQVGNGRFTGTSESILFRFQIPDLWWTAQSFRLPNNDIILWQLSGRNGTLTSASGSLIQENDRNSNINIWNQTGTPLSGSDETFSDYFRDVLDCDAVANDCTLKISVINPLLTSSNSIIPYLEYSIETSNPIPYPNPLMVSEGKSYGFTKSLEVFIPQQATSSAFDFTVLQ